MRVLNLDLRDFRSHHRFSTEIGESITVLVGPNGSGKTNILEGLHFGLTGTSCRTNIDREVIAWGADATRVEVDFETAGAEHTLSAAMRRSGEKQRALDGAALDPAVQVQVPEVVVFLPDRLSLVTGQPGERRAHLDSLVARLTPAKAALRRDYTKALTQRHAIVGSVRRGGTAPSSLAAWEAQLSNLGSELVAARSDLVERLNPEVGVIASELGLRGELTLRNRPAGSADPTEYLAELQARFDQDVEKGFTSYGPHRGDFMFIRSGRDIKSSGSQGEKRVSLLSLLLAEREMVSQQGGPAPMLLLDDVMSELDVERRRLLTARVTRSGQSVITATEADHVPSGASQGRVLVSLELVETQDEGVAG